VSIWFLPWAWTATDWAGVQAVVLAIQAVALAIAAGIAIRQLWEARELRESQARPFVVVDFEVEPAQQAIYIVITNTGSTVARNVTVEFEPELDSSFDRRGRPGLIRDLKPLREGIGTLPPGKRVKVLFDIFTSREEEEAFPDVYRTRVRFDAPALKKRGLRRGTSSTLASIETSCTSIGQTSTTCTNS
jgi:hypothetical protein